MVAILTPSPAVKIEGFPATDKRIHFGFEHRASLSNPRGEDGSITYRTIGRSQSTPVETGRLHSFGSKHGCRPASLSSITGRFQGRIIEAAQSVSPTLIARAKFTHYRLAEVQ